MTIDNYEMVDNLFEAMYADARLQNETDSEGLPNSEGVEQAEASEGDLGCRPVKGDLSEDKG